MQCNEVPPNVMVYLPDGSVDFDKTRELGGLWAFCYSGRPEGDWYEATKDLGSSSDQEKIWTSSTTCVPKRHQTTPKQISATPSKDERLAALPRFLRWLGISWFRRRVP